MKPETGTKVDAASIAAAALRLLDDGGIDGLTMRKVAAGLGVQAPALYWHVKNKRELLDVMADALFVRAVDGIEAPRRDTAWQDWLLDLAGRLRSTLLRHRDGARVLAGTNVAGESLWRVTELTLRTLEDASFSAADAIRVFPILLHYTIGFVIEEQARSGVEYPDGNPYTVDQLSQAVDAARYPLTARMVGTVFGADNDAEFEYGLRVILAGISATTGQKQ
ncbi:TetR/AcrR family transcriptional regulator C-terminal domain-containing protein [Kribbella solani]|uniref:TetR/AcrR family transcriptional regulator C-terminal domain-containing protein n=1 Tax=Kribbella solani TaxID=236067 RepID=UPI0029AFA23A|nr:TetR/AcrR family transcriptional regulator C-terminal domain-containing protein [Kribbella solani]MDX2969935.1 TetR/AcrR family transcriptional regulator C-terminal domain-containing protein [Kribbella solani]MDX3002203.1 TetR/AcrR family transcriptional regulator C-terminal domain-containing protein [Kribbella solani]